MPLTLSDFNYHLPKQLIAQEPVKPRDHSRLLLLNRRRQRLEHKHFYDLPDYLRPGDLLVLNNTKVFPARLIGRKESGGEIEIFLHRHLAGDTWECLIGGKIRAGAKVNFPNGLVAGVLQNNNDGTWQVRFNRSGKKFWSLINKIGLVPLPPYIKRPNERPADRSNYQTVYADPRQTGSVAAPTAGFHFTKSLLKKIGARGVNIVYVTLHIGLGTFALVKTDKISEHKMHAEYVSVSQGALKEILKAKAEGRRVIAVGTTSCRALESLAGPLAGPKPGAAKGKMPSVSPAPRPFWTDIFIYPGYKFKLVDALVTNFHLSKSTLLMLVSAFAGKKKIDKAYKAAIRRRYRFFSYGDAMFIY